MDLLKQPTLKIGDHGAEVGTWQRFLAEGGYVDSRGLAPVVDEVYGLRTHEATADFQKAHNLGFGGALDPPTRRAAYADGFAPFVQAVHFNLRWPKTRDVSLIVVHTMECQETDLNAAESVALWFAGRTLYSAPKASAHFCVDGDSIVQCVREEDVAWHVQSDAADSGNMRSLGIEHAGRAAETAEDWARDASQAILRRSARLVSKLARRHGVPLVRLTPEEVLAGAAGLCGHADVTNAFMVKGGHTDPGGYFPWDPYLDLARAG